jgi:hypothetical protein
LQTHSDELDGCVQQLVDAYFQGFNRSIRSYSDVLACIGEAQNAVRQQCTDLESTAKLVNPAGRIDNVKLMW